MRIVAALLVAGVAIGVGTVGSSAVALARSSKKAAATELPPPSCGTETTFRSAAYSLAIKGCLELALEGGSMFVVYPTTEIRFTRGTTPVSYCRVEFEAVKGQISDISDGASRLLRAPQSCTTAAIRGAVYTSGQLGSPFGIGDGGDGYFGGGAFSTRITVLIGTADGFVRNVISNHTANLPPVTSTR